MKMHPIMNMKNVENRIKIKKRLMSIKEKKLIKLSNLLLKMTTLIL